MENKPESENTNGKIAKKDKYTIDDLLEIMSFLRSENGCPWDLAQTHESIKFNVVEEAFEVVDAINEKEPEKIADELGDLLLQIIFHSQMANEAAEFDFSTVLKKICDKLISRHTHLFGETSDSADSAEAVLQIWDKNKQKENSHSTYTQSMKSIPRSFPSLLKAYKIQKKAARAGFDWAEIEDVATKVEEEFAEVRDAELALHNIVKTTKAESPRIMQDKEKLQDAAKLQKELEGEVGDLLFAIVNYARFLGVEPETALDKANGKFIKRFEQVEKQVIETGSVMTDLTLDELDRIWNKVKTGEKS